MEVIDTGIKGLDRVLPGGLPPNGLYLLSGGTGAGKTIMGLQFCITGAEKGENSLYITLEERKDEIGRNAPEELRKRLEKAQEHLFFLDLTSLRSLSSTEDESEGQGILNVNTLTEILGRWTKERGLKRCTIDGIASIGTRYMNKEQIRADLFRLGQNLKKTNLTTMMTIETPGEKKLSRYGVEEYISDGVVLLSSDGPRRYLEVIKMRGTGFQGGTHDMEILKDGIHVYPQSTFSKPTVASIEREGIGIPGINDMLGEGVSKGDVTLLNGSPGSGKTIIGFHFIKQALDNGEKVLYITFKESRSELARNAKQWGLDIDAMTKKGAVRILDPPIIDLLPNKHLEEVREYLGDVSRVVIDSLDDYEKALTHPKDPDFRHYAEKVVGLIKEKGVTALLLSDSPEIMGSSLPGAKSTMYLADNIILLRYLEHKSEFKRVIAVLKERSGGNSNEIREFQIDKDKVVIGSIFEGIDGIMSGKATTTLSEERVERFFS